jgi:hypothetical protein
VATTKLVESTIDRERVAWYVLLGLVAIVGITVLFSLWNRPPQMGTSEEVFNTVDALYTAVRTRDEKRLGECDQRLKAYRDQGKLPANAADSLDSIIQKARSGSWQVATERLYDFMLAQRREGVVEHHHHKHDKQITKGNQSKNGSIR